MASTSYVQFQSDTLATPPAATNVATDYDTYNKAFVQKVKLDVGPAGRSVSFPGPFADAFGRLRVSQPQAIFGAQFTYDLQPLLFEQTTTGTGATITHDATNRCATLAFSSTGAGGVVEMRSFEHVRYQEGKSQLGFVTFAFGAADANTTHYAGLCDGSNGIELRRAGSTVQMVVMSDTDHGDEIVAQSLWNIDPMDHPVAVFAYGSRNLTACVG